MELNEYQKGWRYLVWVGGVDDAFVHYQDALDSYNGWTRQGYDDVILSKLKLSLVYLACILAAGKNFLYFLYTAFRTFFAYA